MKDFSIKQALVDLSYVSVHLPKIVEDYPDLKPIIRYLVENKALDEDHIPYPSVKDVAEATNIKYDNVRKQISGLGYS